MFHSDLHVMQGDWPKSSKVQTEHKPLVGGHEGAGTVVAVGGERAEQYVRVGDRVGIKWIASADLACEHCRMGDEMLCSKALCSGFDVDGTFQQCE